MESGEGRKGGDSVKQANELTRKMKLLLTAEGLNPDDWVCTANMTNSFIVRHKRTGEVKVIEK